MTPFVSEVDEGCQRGFHIRYTTCGEPPPCILERMSSVWADVVVKSEAWGPRPMFRAIVPFRFEVRFGHRAKQLSLLQRFSASDEERAGDRDAFEELLARVLTEEDEP